MRMVRENPIAAIFTVVLFLSCIATFAYASTKAGRVVPDAEATLLAIPTATTHVDLTALAEYQIGESAVIFGGTYGALVPLFSGPGARTFSSQVLNNTPVTILSIGLDPDGTTIWYELQADAGRGWLTADNLKPAE